MSSPLIGVFSRRQTPSSGIDWLQSIITLLVLVCGLALVGCSGTAAPTGSNPDSVEPTATLILTLVPTATPSSTSTPLPTPTLEPTYIPTPAPDLQTPTPLPALPSVAIGPDNVGQLQLLRTFGEGSSLAIAVSPDGRMLAVVTSNSVSIRDMATLKQLRSFHRGDRVLRAAWSPDGSVLAIGLVNSIHIYRTSNWERAVVLALIPEITDSFQALWESALEFSEDGRLLLFSAPFGEARSMWQTLTWSTDSWESGPVLPGVNVEFRPTDSVVTLTKLLASGKHQIELFDLVTRQTGEVLGNWTHLTFAPDGKWSAACNSASNNPVHLLAEPDYTVLRKLKADGCTGLLFAPDMQWLVVKESNAFRVYDTITWREVARIFVSGSLGSSGSVIARSSASFTPHADAFVVVDGLSVKVFDTHSWNITLELALSTVYPGSSMTFVPDRPLIAVGEPHYDKVVIQLYGLLHPDTPTVLGEHAAGSWKVDDFRVSPDGTKLLSMPVNGAPSLWSLVDHRLIGQVSTAGRGGAHGGDFLNDHLVVTASRYSAGCLELTNIETGKLERYCTDQCVDGNTYHFLDDVVVSTDKHWIAASCYGDSGYRLLVWKWGNSRPVNTKLFANSISFAFIPGRAELLIGEYNSQLAYRLYLQDNSLENLDLQSCGPAWGPVFSPSGDLVICRNGAIHDTRTWQHIHTVPDTRGNVAWSKDNALVSVVSEASTVQVWGISGLEEGD